ncbi:unnamed protein product, partial [Didymodactylos carnosus]
YELSDLLLLDVLPLAVGIEAIDHEMICILQRNTTIPTKRQYCSFTNAYANQKTAIIKIFEGQHRLTEYNIYLGEFSLENLPENFASKTLKITITMDFDCNGILTVGAEESLSDSNVPLLVQLKETPISTDLVDSIFELQNQDGAFSFSKSLEELFNNVNFEKVQQNLIEQGSNSLAKKTQYEINNLICTAIILFYFLYKSTLASSLTFPLDIHSIRNLIENIKEQLQNEEIHDSAMESYIKRCQTAVDYVVKMRDIHSVYCTQLELSSSWELYIQQTLLGL